MLERISKRLEFWAALGPFVILFAFLITIFPLSPQLFLVPALSLLVLPLSWKYGKKGLLVSFLILFGTTLFLLLQGTFHERVWGISFALIILIGLVIMLFSFTEVNKITLFFQNEIRTLLQESSLLKESIQGLLEEHKQELVGMADMMLAKRHENARLRIKLSLCEKDLLQTQGQLQQQSKELQETLEKMNQQALLEEESKENLALRDELKSFREKESHYTRLETRFLEKNEENLALRDELKSFKEKEDLYKQLETHLVEKSAESLGFKNELKELKEKEALYKQLKMQFLEKTEVLSQARVELFQLEGKYLSLQREFEELALCDDICVRKLIKLNQLQAREKTSLEKEVKDLQETISRMLLEEESRFHAHFQ